MSKIKILYLSYDGMTDPLGQSQVIPYLKGLSKYNYVFTVISFEKKNNYEKNQANIRILFDDSGISWVPLSYTKKPPIISTVLDIVRLRRKAFKLQKEAGFKIVHCRSYISSLIGLEMKRKFGCSFIFDMRGFWADERVDGGLWNLNNILFKTIYRFFKKKELEFLTHADYTISLTYCAKKEIYAWKQLSNKSIPIQVIPCCVDLNLFTEKDINEVSKKCLKDKLGLKSHEFILLYLGALGTWYMCEEMLDFFKILLTKKPEAKFLFITMEDPEYILGLAKKKGIEEDKLLIFKASRSEVPLFLAIANASIFFIKPCFSKKASSPVKQGELMSMGVPLICNSGIGDSDDIVIKYQSGILVDEFSEREFTNVATKIDSISALDRNFIKSGAEDYFSLENGIKSYLSVYSQLGDR